MTRLHWVRHGPTHAKTMVGWSDLPADLSDSARLERLSRHLPDDAAVVSSDLMRAVQTADAIAGDRTQLAPDRDLREIHFGEWELQAFDGVPDKALLRSFWETPGDICPPGGESWNAFTARVNTAIDRLLKAHPGRDLIVVAHMGTILTQVQRALGISGYDAFAHKIDNLSVTELHCVAGNWDAVSINHCP